MIKYKIVITSIAEEDIQTGNSWYELQQSELGIEFVEAIEKTIKNLQPNPRQFALIYKGIRRAVVKRFPFGIYYFIKDDLINIFAVVHFSRNPIIWKKRIK